MSIIYNSTTVKIKLHNNSDLTLWSTGLESESGIKFFDNIVPREKYTFNIVLVDIKQYNKNGEYYIKYVCFYINNPYEQAEINLYIDNNRHKPLIKTRGDIIVSHNYFNKTFLCNRFNKQPNIEWNRIDLVQIKYFIGIKFDFDIIMYDDNMYDYGRKKVIKIDDTYILLKVIKNNTSQNYSVLSILKDSSNSISFNDVIVFNDNIITIGNNNYTEISVSLIDDYRVKLE